MDAGYLQRLKIAPANESYVISILRFLGLIDEGGNRVADKTDYFFGNDDSFDFFGNDDSFKSGLEGTVRSAYSQVFDDMGDGALESPKDDLTHWFRAADKTSELVGQRQASTFQTLAALAGHGELPARSGAAKKTTAPTPESAAKKKITTSKATTRDQVEKPGVRDGGGVKNGQNVGLTVRIEVNLPLGGDANTYDAIFASIKKHFMS